MDEGGEVEVLFDPIEVHFGEVEEVNPHDWPARGLVEDAATGGGKVLGFLVRFGFDNHVQIYFGRKRLYLKLSASKLPG